MPSRKRSRKTSPKSSKINSRSKSRTNHTLVIHVHGIQGSGKSWICEELSRTLDKSSNVACLDMDDISLWAKDYVDKSKSMPRTWISVQKVIKQRIADLIQKHKKANLLLFVGVGEVPNTDYRFFIKLGDLDSTFRRVMKRELDKMVEHQAKLRKIISSTPDPNEIDDLVNRAANLAIPFPSDFEGYKKLYKSELKFAKEKGYQVNTQQEILQWIRKKLNRLHRVFD